MFSKWGSDREITRKVRSSFGFHLWLCIVVAFTPMYRPKKLSYIALFYYSFKNSYPTHLIHVVDKGWNHNFTMFFQPLFERIAQTPHPPLLNEKTWLREIVYPNFAVDGRLVRVSTHWWKLPIICSLIKIQVEKWLTWITWSPMTWHWHRPYS